MLKKSRRIARVVLVTFVVQSATYAAPVTEAKPGPARRDRAERLLPPLPVPASSAVTPTSVGGRTPAPVTAPSGAAPTATPNVRKAVRRGAEPAAPVVRIARTAPPAASPSATRTGETTPPDEVAANAVTRQLSLPAGWNFVSIPLLPANPDPGAVFEGVDPLWLYDYALGQTVGVGEPGLRNPGPGRAQWLLLKEPRSFSIAGDPINATAGARLGIGPGWNGIGNPWLSSLEWSDARVSVQSGTSTVPLTQALAQGWIQALRMPDPAGGYAEVPAGAGDLEPWQGYLLFSAVTGSLVLTAPPPDTVLPTVGFEEPALTMTEPTTVAGTATDDNLLEWRLEYAPTGTGSYTVVATGTRPVANGTLGQVDPTLMVNGLYDLRLVATDVTGNSAAATIPLVVKGNMKVGHFTVSFVDLQVPVAGLPITLTRTYDSRDLSRGDFGHGWRLDVSSVTARANGPAGEGWVVQTSGGTMPSYCHYPTRAHVVTVTGADGRVYEFEPFLARSCQPFDPTIYTQMLYRPRPGSGTLGTLVPQGPADVIATGGLITDYAGQPYDPSGFRLILPDGRVLEISRTAGLQSLTDLNGNRLSYGPGGITHSSGMGIFFTRDGLGRITAIRDPSLNEMTYAYDASGDLASYTDRESNVTTFAYSADIPHYLAEIEDPLGRPAIRNEYDAGGRLIAHVDARGERIEYTHAVAGRQEIVTDRMGNPTLLVYDDRGNVLSETNQAGEVTERTYDERDNRLTETNGEGETTTYAYDAQDNVTTVKDPLGNTTEFTYNARKQVLTTKDPNGNVTENVYDGAGNLVTTRVKRAGDALVVTETSYTYWPNGEVRTHSTVVGGVSQQTTYAYDAYGRLTSETDALGRTSAYTYDANGNRLTEARTRSLPGGGTETLTTKHTYDKLGRLTKTEHPDTTTTESVYDALGRVVTAKDALGRETSYAYDELGRLVTTTYPDATAETSEYDKEGRRTRQIDRAGRPTSYSYDPVGRLVGTTHPDGATASNTYDDTGRLVATTDALANVTRYAYDDAGRRTSVTQQLGGQAIVTEFTYDGNGNQTSVKDPKGTSTGYVYDALNRRVRTNFADGTFTETTYDEAGRRVQEKDQATRATAFRYDALGRLTGVVAADSTETVYGYDEVGNRVSQRDALGRLTQFEYDAMGRETARVLPDAARETRQYDAAGNLVLKTDFMGRPISYAYNAVNRLVTKSYPSGAPVEYVYTATGRRSRVTDARGVTSYAYDLRDRPVSATYPDGRRLSYAYDANGNRTTLRADAGGLSLTTGYAYDALSRLATVTDTFGRVYTHGYDANGNRTALAQPNGTVTSYGYDSLNRLRTQTTNGPAGLVQSYALTLGPAGTRTAIEEHTGTPQATLKSYAYDTLYRLTRETVSGALAYENAFTYDAVGNRLAQTKTAAGTINYTYDDRDRLLQEAAQAYTWDANGNLVSKSAEATYTWDYDDRLVGVLKADGTTITHVYDADGNRVRTTTALPAQPPVAVDYLVDTSGALSHVVAETMSGALAAHYVRGDDLLSVIRPDGSGGWQTRFYHSDYIGSVRRLTDETGTVRDEYEYSAFGERLSHQGSDPQPYAFTGEPLDPNSGLQYHRARWMDPGVGRFAGMDQYPARVADPNSLHRYTYGSSDPARATDPTGQFSVEFAVVTGLILVLAAIALPVVVNSVRNGGAPVIIDFEWRNAFLEREHAFIWKQMSPADIEFVKLTAFMRLREAYQGFGRIVISPSGGGTKHVEVKNDAVTGTAASCVGAKSVRCEIGYGTAERMAWNDKPSGAQHQDYIEGIGRALGFEAAHEMGHAIGVPHMDLAGDANKAGWEYWADDSPYAAYGSPHWHPLNQKWLYEYYRGQ